MEWDWIYQGWQGPVRTALVGCLAYAGVIVLLRASGKRTLAQLNAFDLVVTVAIGSVLASTLLSKNVSLAQGLAGFATLVALQTLLARASLLWPGVAGLIRAEPALLMRDGEICRAALKRERVTEAELMTVIRSSTTPTPADVSAVILESNGTFSVISRTRDGEQPDYATARLGLDRQD